MKIVNIDEESLHIFWTTWGISMTFSGKEKMWLMTVLKVIKNAGRHALSRRYIFEKTKGMGGQIDPSLQVFF